MSEDLGRQWVSFLRNNQITEMKPDPATHRLVYRRAVVSEDVVRFLHNRLTLDEATVREIVERVAGAAAKAPAAAAGFGGFVDDPGVEMSEEQVRRAFGQAQQRVRDAEQKERSEEVERDDAEAKEALLSRMKRKLASSMDDEQRPAFASVVRVLQAGGQPLRPSQVNGTFLALKLTHRSRGGFLSSLMGRRTAPPDPDRLESAWRAAGLPLDREGFVAFLARQGFDEARVASALRQSEQLPDVDTFQSEGQFDSLLKLAGFALEHLDAGQVDDLLAHLGAG